MHALRRHPAPLWLSAVLVSAYVAACVPASHAQMHHVDAPERVTRAIGVYEWTGDLNKPTAARFIPVSLFIDGHFEDAGLYLARPVPFALQTGDVYSLERAGEPAGLLDLDFARHIVSGNALADDNPAGAWYGFGKFTVETAPKTTPLHASRHPATLQTSAGPNTPAGTKLPPAGSDDDGPHMSRRNSGTASTSDSSTQTSGGSAGTGSSQSGSGSTTSTSPASSTAKNGSTASTGSTSDDSNDDLDRPTLRKRDPSQDAARRREYGSKGKTTSGVTAAGPALGDDPDRPTLTRGSAEEASTPELSGLPPDLHQAVAVSDATHRDAHVFARDWDSPAERNDTLAAMAALARPAVASYLATNHLVPSAAPITQAAVKQAAPGQATAPVPAREPANSDAGAPPRLQRGVPQQYRHPTASPAADTTTPAPPATTPKITAVASATRRPVTRTPTSHSAAHPVTHPASLTLAQENISGFTLSYGGLPTFVYTAATAVAPGPGSPAGAANAVAYVTVVAQRLPGGELQVALNNVTDSIHLDRGPRLRLIDAVDPDDSHRASLLFELRGNNSRQFALYRLTAVRAEQTFTTASIE